MTDEFGKKLAQELRRRCNTKLSLLHQSAWYEAANELEQFADSFMAAYASHVTSAQQKEKVNMPVFDITEGVKFARKWLDEQEIRTREISGKVSTISLENVLTIYANDVVASLTKERDELKLELGRQKKRVCVGGDVFEAGRNQHILHLQTELDYLERAEKAEAELAKFKALDQYLPKHYAIGDDATATLAIELAESKGRVEELEKALRELIECAKNFRSLQVQVAVARKAIDV